MVDPLAIGSLIASLVAIVFAALTWLESRKLRQLFGTVAKSLPLVARSRSKLAAKESTTSAGAKAAAEERRRLKLELEREKHEWRKNRDIVKTIGWFLERMNADEYDEE